MVGVRAAEAATSRVAGAEAVAGGAALPAAFAGVGGAGVDSFVESVQHVIGTFVGERVVCQRSVLFDAGRRKCLSSNTSLFEHGKPLTHHAFVSEGGTPPLIRAYPLGLALTPSCPLLIYSTATSSPLSPPPRPPDPLRRLRPPRRRRHRPLARGQRHRRRLPTPVPLRAPLRCISIQVAYRGRAPALDLGRRRRPLRLYLHADLLPRRATLAFRGGSTGDPRERGQACRRGPVFGRRSR